ncbi:hypothetical protein B0H17DRAFT_1144814 [Mycena rosella]|uniref:Uncharacterized protein n=1 Tax=Mycena rosella TaxID=1033263 RepID=A0AAD7CSM8_MYCRO|nr:hypothetical protein B0H17DRAFT_1144814 [Mycena rosella]
MASRSASLSDDGNLDDVYSAMNQSSPVRPPGTPRVEKRRHSESADQDDIPETEAVPTGATAPGTGPVNKHLVAAIQRYTARKRLREDQKTDIEVFVKDPPALREAKMYAETLHLGNLISKITTAAPPYEVSDDLKKNIYSYATAIFLSTTLTAYKGNTPKNVLHAILKKHRFDLLAGIKHNPGNWVQAKVEKCVQDAFTQTRSNLKKDVRHLSITQERYLPKLTDKQKKERAKKKDKDTEIPLLSAKYLPAYAATHTVAEEDRSRKFWDTVDIDLEKICKKAGGEPKKIIRAFRHILETDRTTHGKNGLEIEDTHCIEAPCSHRPTWPTCVYLWLRSQPVSTLGSHIIRFLLLRAVLMTHWGADTRFQQNQGTPPSVAVIARDILAIPGNLDVPREFPHVYHDEGAAEVGAPSGKTESYVFKTGCV